MTRCNVLLSSAGRRVALLEIFRRTLREMDLEGEVIAADVSRLSSAFHRADRAVQVPRCTTPEFIPAMLDLCQRHEVALVVPTIDTELPMYAAHRQEFEFIGTRVAVSTSEVIRIGGDKVLTHAWLTEKGFPTVRQAPLEDYFRDPSGWAFPLIVKPRDGSSSIGVAVVNDRQQLDAATRRGGYLVQTVASGTEHTVDFLASWDGHCRCAVPRRRLEVRAGEVSKAVTVRSEPLQALAKQLCETLPGAYGALNVQVFLDSSTGRMSIIEINPRFGGGFPLAWEAGARFPRWILEELTRRPSTVEADGWKSGLCMLRYDEAVFVDATAAGL